MKVARQPAQLVAPAKPVCVAIGVFDGVHLGHQSILQDLKQHAEKLGASAVAVTFDRHPLAVVDPERAPRLIQTLGQRLRTLEHLALDAAWVIEFDAAFSRLTGEEFIALLVQGFGRLSSIHVGQHFHFGYRRTGNVALLHQLEGRFGFATRGLPPCLQNGQAVSSTRIRQAIRHGDLHTADRMLGRRYAVGGRVVIGDGRARRLGFPTANLDVAGLTLPPAGVYAARALWAGQTAHAVVNIGRRPTIDSANQVVGVEAHLLDRQIDLYGHDLELVLANRLRDERTFPNLDALKHQIAKDIVAARASLEKEIELDASRPTLSPMS